MKKMSYQGAERPARWQSKLTVIMMSGVVVALVAGVITQNPLVGIGVFIAVWIIGFIGQFFYHAANAFGNNRPALEEHKGSITQHQDVDPSTSHESRLAKLKALHDSNLITTEDFETRKKEIINEI